MALESVTFLDDLVVTNPDGTTDNVSAGDDHIRNLKTGLKNSFPDVDQAVSTIIFSTTEPTLNRKGTLWGDETTNLLKLRNKADTAWITLPFSMTTDNTVDINGGTIDGTAIGNSAPSTARVTAFHTRGDAAIDNGFVYRKSFRVSVTTWSTLVTLTPSVTPVGFVGLFKVTMAGHTSATGDGIKVSEWYAQEGGAFTEERVLEIGTKPPGIRLQEASEVITIQVQSSDGIAEFRGVVEVELFIPRDFTATNGTTWTIT